MQSTILRAHRILAWEQIDLPNQVYRVQNVRWLEGMPDLSEGWVDCTDNPQWLDELDIALEMMGMVREGVWHGLGQTIAGVCHGLGWMVT